MASELEQVGQVGVRPHDDALSDSVVELIDAVRTAVENRSTLSIHGGGTKSWYGNRADGTALDVRSHAGVVDYEPSELVVVARAGTPLAQVEALLAKNRQMLAFEPPHFVANDRSPPPSGDDAISRAMHSARRGPTLGGCVAAGLSGPRRMAAGSLRDFVLGARLIDGRGQHLAFGGKVMKNVAGYDVSRALAGSLGTLGVITEVSLKVLPIPEQSTTLAFTLDEHVALERMNQWGGQPIAITATTWRSAPSQGTAGGYSARAGQMLVRLEGSEAAVQSGIRRIGGLDVDPGEAAAAWHDLCEQTDSFFTARSSDSPLWRLALPPAATGLDAAALGFDAQLIEWGGAQRWIATRAEAETVRAAAAALGGHATLWRASDALKDRCGVFAPLSVPTMAIHRRLKAEFDPHGVFNRGRLYPGL